MALAYVAERPARKLTDTMEGGHGPRPVINLLAVQTQTSVHGWVVRGRFGLLRLIGYTTKHDLGGRYWEPNSSAAASASSPKRKASSTNSLGS